MLKALLWKEWREQRAIAYAGALVALMIPAIVIASVMGSGSSDLVAAADIVPFLSAMVVWPLFAALAGATSGVERSSSGSAAFLLSRPVGHNRLWLVKVTIALVSISFVVAVSFFASLQVSFWVAGWGFRFPFSSDPLPLPGDAVRAMALGGLLVTFTSAVWLSTFMRRSLAAVVAAIAVGIGSQAIGLVVAGRMGEAIGVAPGSGAFLVGYAGMVSAAMLAASLYVFRAGGWLGSEGGSAMIRATVGIVAVVPPALALAGFASTRITSDTALVYVQHTVPGTVGVVVRLHGGGFADSSLWVATPDDPLRRLTGRLTRSIGVSPNGEWLAYASRRSVLGTRSSQCEVRAVRLDGTEDRSVLAIDSASWCVGKGAFSPDSQRLALKIGSPYRVTPGLVVVSLVGDSPREFDLSSLVAASTGHSGYELNWLSSDELSMTVSGRHVWRINTGDGTIHVPNEYEGSRRRGGRILARAGSFLLVAEGTDTRDRGAPLAAELIDLSDGSARALEPMCAPTVEISRDLQGEVEAVVSYGVRAALAVDGSRIFYSCPRPVGTGGGIQTVADAGPWESELIRRDLATGGEGVIAKLEGRLSGLWLSPDGERVLAIIADNPRSGYIILEENGGWWPLDIGPEWRVGEWLGNRLLELRTYQRHSRAVERLAYLDIDEPTGPRSFNLSAGR